MSVSDPVSASIVTVDVPLETLRAVAQEGHLWCILDACDEPKVPRKVLELGGELAVSLYDGKAHDDYWAIAPYLVYAEEATLDWIVRELWHEPWGIFVVSGAGIEELRKHFRRLLAVESPSRELWYFRFYDPRVLGVFLESCDQTQIGQLTGPVEAFGVGRQDGARLYAPASQP